MDTIPCPIPELKGYTLTVNTGSYVSKRKCCEYQRNGKKRKKNDPNKEGGSEPPSAVQDLMQAPLQEPTVALAPQSKPITPTPSPNQWAKQLQDFVEQLPHPHPSSHQKICKLFETLRRGVIDCPYKPHEVIAAFMFDGGKGKGSTESCLISILTIGFSEGGMGKLGADFLDGIDEPAKELSKQQATTITPPQKYNIST
ncbi:hypothetical protein VNI00_000072 [Paramarasmius palmivorus]|uniref:Uncharacterized protein n=1 Tax=Paramarasmius palmivorus TaxID=297713 RepID=A0AAW0EE86_9AGAR